jgi:hypothetical protein
VLGAWKYYVHRYIVGLLQNTVVGVYCEVRELAVRRLVVVVQRYAADSAVKEAVDYNDSFVY